MVDTAGTLCKAAQALKEHGAVQVVAYCTHPVLSGRRGASASTASVLDELVVTDTIPLRPEARGVREDPRSCRSRSCSPRRCADLRGESVSSLFVE